MGHSRSRVRTIARWLLHASSGHTDGAGTDGDETDELAPARSAMRQCFAFQSRRIAALLEDGGGCVWQNEIVAETGWSRPKASRVLSRMEDEDRIERYRFGRQKVVCLPGHDPTDPVRRVD